MTNKFDFIFSIGAACSCTSVLRDLNLQDASYPFDWLYGGGLQKRCELLINNMENFIEIQDLVKLDFTNNDANNPCDVYENKINGLVFNHDFKEGIPIEEIHEKVKEKYQRRIKRLYSRINNAKTVLAIYIETPIGGALNIDIVKEQLEKLKNKFGEKKFNLLYVYNDPKLEHSRFDIEMPIEGLFFARGNYPDLNNAKYAYAIDMELAKKIVFQVVQDGIYRDSETNEYNLVASLGGNCAAAHNLLYYQKRFFSLPFDWVYAESNRAFEYLSEGFANHFIDLCKKENLIKVQGYAKHGDFLQYRDTYTDYVFLNHFLRDINNTDEYEIVIEKLKRRIDRFYNKINESNKILFIINVSKQFPIESFFELHKTLNKLYPGKIIDLRVEMFGFGIDQAKTIVNKEGTIYLKFHKRGSQLEDFSSTTKEWNWIGNLNIRSELSLVEIPNMVSVIIPAYNHENYIQQTIKSIINQTCENIELIVIDDGSTDSTWEKIQEMKEECEKRFKRVAFSKQENKGKIIALNSLIMNSKGEYIYLIEGDSLAKETAINEEFEFLSKNNDYALCVGDNDFIDKDGNKINLNKENFSPETDKEYSTYANFLEDCIKFKLTSSRFSKYEEFYKENFIPNGYLIRKSIFNKIGLFTKEAPLEDWWLALQISKYSKLKFIDKVLFSYRLNEQSALKLLKKNNSLFIETKAYEDRLIQHIDLRKMRLNAKFFISKILKSKRKGIFSKMKIKSRAKLFFYFSVLAFAQIPLLDLFVRRKQRNKIRQKIDEYWR